MDYYAPPRGNFATGLLLALVVALFLDGAIAYGVYSLVNWL